MASQPGFDRKTGLREESRTPAGDEDLPRKAGMAGMQKLGPMDLKAVTGQPILRISRTDLDNLMSTLEVSFVKLAECLVSPGWRLVLSQTDAPGIHYCLSGTGRMVIGDHPPIDLVPHTLIIAPRGLPVRVRDGAAGRYPAQDNGRALASI